MTEPTGTIDTHCTFCGKAPDLSVGIKDHHGDWKAVVCQHCAELMNAHMLAKLKPLVSQTSPETVDIIREWGQAVAKAEEAEAMARQPHVWEVDYEPGYVLLKVRPGYGPAPIRLSVKVVPELIQALKEAAAAAEKPWPIKQRYGIG